MTGFLRLAMSVGSVVCVVAVAGLTSSSVVAGDVSAEARIEWAKRHVELVCRPLEANKLSARAAKCYEEVSLFIADPKREIPAEVEAIPLRRSAGDGVVAQKAVAPKAAAVVAPEHKPAVAAVKKPAPKMVADAPVQTTAPVAKTLPIKTVDQKSTDTRTGDAKRPVRRVVRVASIRHRKPHVAAVRPVVMASNDRIPAALAAAQENVSVRRCGLPCSRFTTILGVGY